MAQDNQLGSIDLSRHFLRALGRDELLDHDVVLQELTVGHVRQVLELLVESINRKLCVSDADQRAFIQLGDPETVYTASLLDGDDRSLSLRLTAYDIDPCSAEIRINDAPGGGISIEWDVVERGGRYRSYSQAFSKTIAGLNGAIVTLINKSLLRGSHIGSSLVKSSIDHFEVALT